ncbi:MAG: type I restriction enzyme HsdR N-terminal domain-containing protein [Bacteroidales bacterium]|nr:type I restriction enzyme HsdR N-terminal domain-containing protein [Bacteroidales bacterium]
MIKLNLPEYSFRLSNRGDQVLIFDPFRKKQVVLTPEEWVRQNFLQFLIKEKHYPESLIKVEMGLKLNKLLRRSDIVVFDKLGKPFLMVECKAPNVKISQKVFDQIARYNLTLKVDYLIVTNGLEHFCCKLNFSEGSYSFLQEIPAYTEIVDLSGSDKL